MAFTRPRKIIDLDATPEANWQIETNALHIYLSESWIHEQVGCILCADAERRDPRGQTLRRDNNEHEFICLTHGKLEEVPYKVQRTTVVQIGSMTKEAINQIGNMVLFPVEMEATARELLFEKLVSAIIEGESNSDNDD